MTGFSAAIPSMSAGMHRCRFRLCAQAHQIMALLRGWHAVSTLSLHPVVLCCRCVPILHSLAAISPNANELWAIADAVQQQQGLPPLPRPRPGSQQCDHSSASPQLVLAQLAPAAAVVLQQGEHSWVQGHRHMQGTTHSFAFSGGVCVACQVLSMQDCMAPLPSCWGLIV